MGKDEEMLVDWNGYSFKVVEKFEIPKILSLLRRTFYLDEPMHKTLGFSEDRAADMDIKQTEILGLGHGSFYAIPKDHPDQVAAVLIIWNHKKGFELTPFEERSPITGKIKKTVSTLKDKYNIFEERGVTEYPELYIIATDRNHRGKGLATEMYRRAITKIKSEGYPFVSSMFTNPLSRRIGEKFGFKQVARVNFNDIKNDDGSLVFGEAGDSHFIVETVLDFE